MKINILIVYFLINFSVPSDFDTSIESRSDNYEAGLRISSVGSKETEITTRSSNISRKTKNLKLTTIVFLRRGPFYRLLVNIGQALLMVFQTNKISAYFNVLYKSLRKLGIGYYMKRLALRRLLRLFKTFSRINGELLKPKIKYFLEAISYSQSRKPLRNSFIIAMDAIFSVYDDNKMDDYILRLIRYGQCKKKHIGDETRNIMELIFRKIKKQKKLVKKDIIRKFKLAMLEFLNDIKIEWD